MGRSWMTGPQGLERFCQPETGCWGFIVPQGGGNAHSRTAEIGSASGIALARAEGKRRAHNAPAERGPCRDILPDHRYGAVAARAVIYGQAELSSSSPL